MNQEVEPDFTTVVHTLRERFPEWYKDNVFHDMSDALSTFRNFDRELQINGKRVRVVINNRLWGNWTTIAIRIYDNVKQSRVYETSVWRQKILDAKYKPEFTMQLVSSIMSDFKNKVLDESNH